MPRLLLVDASSYLYRAFHAMPNLRSPQGEPTGAVYGVLNMLRRLRLDYPSEYIACVFDAKGKTFRDDIYPQYKAQRPPMPPELVAQIAVIHECTRALGWAVVEKAGVEADDVIGTLAKQAASQGVSVLISTGDKDLAQLVDVQISLINTMTNEFLDEAGVEEKFGIPPARIVDYLTLIGDTVDNVPGVDKVGPKTALKWLKEYGTLDHIVERAGDIKGAVGEHLRTAIPWLPTARKLLSIDCEVPGLAFTEMTPLALDIPSLESRFLSLGFRAWLKDKSLFEHTAVPLASGDASPTEPRAESTPTEDEIIPLSEPITHYETITTLDDLSRWLEKLRTAPLSALDTETTGLDPMRSQLVGISFAVRPLEAAYLPLQHRGLQPMSQIPIQVALEHLRPWLEGEQYHKLGQHSKYDQHILANHGITLRGMIHDTLLQSYVLEPHLRHDLGGLVLRHLRRKTTSYEELCDKGAKQIGFDEVPIDKASHYAAEDAEITLQLHQTLLPRLLAEPQLHRIYELEMQVSPVLWRMERHGVCIDKKLLSEQSVELGTRLIQLEQEAYILAKRTFNLGSPKQIGTILYEELGMPVYKKTPKGAPSTDEDVLERLAENYPLPRVLLEHRHLAKLKSTYTDRLVADLNSQTGRIHTDYAQAVAVTGRLSSNDPNLQNIPIRTTEGRRIREAFIAPPGFVIMSADYSQIELRIMAHISRDLALLTAFAGNEDVHRATAAEIMGIPKEQVTPEQRRYAKTINFGLIYGMSAFGLARSLGIDQASAKRYIDRYFERFAGVKTYMENTREEARKKGYVETVLGRRLWLMEINSPQAMRRQAAERAAINAPMQGTAADLIKLAMVAVDKWIIEQKLDSRLIMQVHDELVLEVKIEEREQVRKEIPLLMSGVASLAVPLTVDIGEGASWESAH